MELNLDNTTVLFIVAVIFILWFCWGGNQENWTHLGGAPQQWAPMGRDPIRCDTDFNDDQCKYSTHNCIGNPHSALMGIAN